MPHKTYSGKYGRIRVELIATQSHGECRLIGSLTSGRSKDNLAPMTYVSPGNCTKNILKKGVKLLTDKIKDRQEYDWNVQQALNRLRQDIENA